MPACLGLGLFQFFTYALSATAVKPGVHQDVLLAKMAELGSSLLSPAAQVSQRRLRDSRKYRSMDASSFQRDLRKPVFATADSVNSTPVDMNPLRLGESTSIKNSSADSALVTKPEIQYEDWLTADGAVHVRE